ncbi:MAG: 50S ribosomal protein L15 [Gemmatimonadetes bacterium]|nr:50S ribosomal protein L15 [Gemmatimonadota bacterium]MCA9763896.1 50S ribosomal protein L15 [Gemmatimonadota bacterium]HPF62904.1 50S ribosomal protein L15 [Gemmatimonadales bacterium]HRX19770.1 50S ribosomal protein L15 [Gemmatimonadales bacterium]
MTLSTLKPAPGSRQARKRVGRGPGSGLGKTSGRGHKGHKARSGGSTNPGFEGGQMPLYRRLPKRGFTNPFKVTYLAVNLRDLDAVEGTEVTPESLVAAGILKKASDPVKLLGHGDVSRALTVRGLKASASAVAKIEAAGGKVES